MSTYAHETVTVWAVMAPSEGDLISAVSFEYPQDDEEARSAFSTAYRTGWYDDDFAFHLCGDGLSALLADCSRSLLTLDQQATPHLPAGLDWNAPYVIAGGAGEVWQREERRPPMPHGAVRVAETTFKLIGTFPVVAKS